MTRSAAGTRALSPAADGQPVAPAAPVAAPAPVPRRLVLCADASAIARRLLDDALTAAGYAFVGVESGTGCIAALGRVRPAVILLDVALAAGIDGLETCRRIRLHPVWARIPVLFMSRLECEEEVELGMAAGGNDFVGKPVSVVHLLRRLDFWSERSVPPPPHFASGG